MPEVVRTVCMELLRAGPPHNQLLSPLTRYLAVCGDSQAGEVNAPYEHAQLIHRLRELRYIRRQDSSDGESGRRFALTELARDMSRFLAQVPGLRAQLAPRSCKNELIHLQIMANAAELAVLPFELAGNLEAAGQEVGDYLLLGSRPRVTLTRRLRGVSDSCVRWPTKPRILFVAASPMVGVPFQQHLEALLRALQPWLPSINPSLNLDAARSAYTKAWQEQLTVLEHATIGDIAKKCAEHDFTHVHVLAHGAVDESSPGRQYGVMLHSGDDPHRPHVVSGAQFASAIRRDGGGGPSIVTLAACDSANNEDIMYTGASFAFDIHRGGVAFVLASQLPLSVGASVDICEEFYKRLLRGEDPREVLYDLRIRLHSFYASTTHDWATLVAYASLPSDFEEQLVELRYSQARRATNFALDSIDRELEEARDHGEQQYAAGVALLGTLLPRVESAAALVPTDGKYGVEGFGLLGAYQKRLAEFHFQLASANRPEYYAMSIVRLERALSFYEQSFFEGVRLRADEVALASTATHWPVVQMISILAVLGRDVDGDDLATARRLSKADMDRGNRDAELWAMTSYLEVKLFEQWLVVPNAKAAEARDQVDHSIGSLARRIVLLSGARSEVVSSTSRQLKRYLNWWWKPDFQQALRPREQQTVPAGLFAELQEAIDLFDDHLRLHPTGSLVSRKR